MVKKIKCRLEDLVEGRKIFSDSLIIGVSDNEIVTIKRDLSFKRIGVFTYGINTTNGETCEIYNKSFNSVYPSDKYELYKQKLEEAKLW